jgi:hypothetical protein
MDTEVVKYDAANMSEDPAQEYQRLADVYRSKDESDLTVIASEANQLTEVARQALKAEIAARGLEIELAEPPPPEEPIFAYEGSEEGEEDVEEPLQRSELDEEYDLQVKTRAWTPEEAEKIHQQMTDARIAHFFGAENVDDPKDITSDFSEGVVVKVRNRDSQRTSAFFFRLGQLEDEAERDAKDPDGILDAEETEEDEPASAMKCPKCQNLEITLKHVDRLSPSPYTFNTRYHWYCEACGNKWTDDGVESVVSEDQK